MIDFTQFQPVNDLLYELHSCTTWKELKSFTIQRLHEFMNSERTAWTEFPRDIIIGHAEWSEGASHLQETYLPVIKLYMEQHPIERRIGASTRLEQCYRIADLISQREFEKTELYNEGYRPSGVRHQIALQAHASNFGSNFITLGRANKAFTDQERQTLNFLMPHMRLVYDRLLREQRAREAFSERLRAIADPHPYLAVDKDLFLRDANEEALSLMNTLSSFDGIRLPQEIAHSLGDSLHSVRPISTTLTLNGRTYRVTGNQSEYEGFRYVSLESIDTAEPSDGCNLITALTRRQNEIALWIKAGKTNPEIAKILGISERTVHKHVENIFRTLGIENRFSLMANY